MENLNQVLQSTLNNLQLNKKKKFKKNNLLKNVPTPEIVYIQLGTYIQLSTYIQTQNISLHRSILV